MLVDSGWAVVLCCLLCVGCVPYILNGTKDVEHKCGKVGGHLPLRLLLCLV